MYLILDATDPSYKTIISAISAEYLARNSKFQPILDLKETQAYVNIKIDLPTNLLDDIAAITLQETDQHFLKNEVWKDVTDWWPSDMTRFLAMYQNGTYKGSRVATIMKDRIAFEDDAEDARRTKLGLPPRTFPNPGIQSN